MRRILLFVFLSCLLSAGLHAETVNRISLKSTTGRPISRELVEANMRLQQGGPFSPDTLSEDIKTLYNTKQFDDIEVTVDRVNESTVNLILLLTPKSRVISISFDGNRKISLKKLQKKLTHEEGAVLNEKLLKEDLESIIKLYKDKNYHEAVINQEIKKLPETGDVAVIYHIQENARVKTRGIAFEGNTVFTDRKLRKLISTSVSFWGYFLPAGFFKKDVFEDDLTKLRDAYLEKGYLDFEVTNVDKRIPTSAKKVFLTITLSEGQAYTMTAIHLVGYEKAEGETVVFTLEQLQGFMQLKAGATFNQKFLDEDRARITDEYNHLGYLDCQVSTRIEPNADTHTAEIYISISEGKRSNIRNINISGNRTTHDNVIRRELQIQPGDLSDSTKIKSSKNRLMNLGYFKSVDMIPVATDTEEEKDINIRVDETETGRLMLGAGLSSADSAFGTAEIAQTNFDLFGYPSFRGAGQRLRLKTQIGTTRQDYSLSFTEPWLFNRPLRLDYKIWRTDVSSNRDWDESSMGMSGTLTRSLKTWDFWRQSFGYRIEQVDISNIDESFSPGFREREDGTSLVSAVTFGMSRDTRNSLKFTSSGLLINATSEFQSELIGSYTNLWKLRLSADKYIPVLKESVIKFSGDIASESAVGGDDPRVFDRYFAGGLNSVRGFKERSLGPTDPDNGDAVGGQSMLLGSAEFITPVYGDVVRWVFFTDAGNVWEGSYDWNPAEVNVSVGTGVRLLLPIGAVSIDYGFPILRQDDKGSGGRLHFALGYNF